MVGNSYGRAARKFAFAAHVADRQTLCSSENTIACSRAAEYKDVLGAFASDE